MSWCQVQNIFNMCLYNSPEELTPPPLCSSISRLANLAVRNARWHFPCCLIKQVIKNSLHGSVARAGVIYTLCRWPPNSVNHSFPFSKPTETTATEAEKYSLVVCSGGDMSPVWNYHGQTCGLEKPDHRYSFVVLSKRLQNGRATRITPLHYSIGGFH